MFVHCVYKVQENARLIAKITGLEVDVKAKYDEETLIG